MFYVKINSNTWLKGKVLTFATTLDYLENVIEILLKVLRFFKIVVKENGM